MNPGAAMVEQAEITHADEEIRRLRRQILSRLDEEPLEDGVSHSAEKVVEDAIVGPAAQLDAFMWLFEAESNPELAASLLRLVGRVGRTADRDMRGMLVRRALHSPSAMLREAAVEAVEHWEDSEFLPLLRSHTEAVPWLKSYIDDVLEDLCE